jgi:hypothetical protein
MEILGILFARARRRASARQKLTPHDLMNEWGSVADQQIAKPRACGFIICRVEERQHEGILLWTTRGHGHAAVKATRVPYLTFIASRAFTRGPRGGAAGLDH